MFSFIIRRFFFCTSFLDFLNFIASFRTLWPPTFAKRLSHLATFWKIQTNIFIWFFICSHFSFTLYQQFLKSKASILLFDTTSTSRLNQEMNPWLSRKNRFYSLEHRLGNNDEQFQIRSATLTGRFFNFSTYSLWGNFENTK